MLRFFARWNPIDLFFLGATMGFLDVKLGLEENPSRAITYYGHMGLSLFLIGATISGKCKWYQPAAFGFGHYLGANLAMNLVALEMINNPDYCPPALIH